MFTKELELGVLRLTSAQDKLQLIVRSIAIFHLPDTLSQPRDEDIIKAMSSGGLWVSRGPHCRLLVVIYVDSKFAEAAHWHTLYQMVGQRLRNTPLWNQLSIATSTEIDLPSVQNDNKPCITIKLNHGPKVGEAKLSDSILSHAHMDVRPPEGISCAMLDGLRLECNFADIDWAQKRWKVSPTFRDTSLLAPSFLRLSPKPLPAPLDLIKRSDPEPVTQSFISVAKEPGKSCRIASVPQKDPRHQVQPSPTLKRKRLPVKVEGSLSIDAHSVKDRHGVIQKWLKENEMHPFPTKSQRSSLAETTGYTQSSLMNLLSYYRNKLKLQPSVVDAEPQKNEPSQQSITLHDAFNSYENNEMLLGTEVEEAPWDLEDDEMLLKLADEPSWPDLVTPTLTPSTPIDLKAPWVNLDTPTLHPAVLELIPSIPVTASCTLIETAVRIALGGQQSYIPRGVEVFPKISIPSLSLLTPSLFNPGFANLMSQNALFIPKIVPVLTSSWPQNVQGAGLQLKLQLLAALDSSRTLIHIYARENDNPRTIANLVEEIVQRKLWTMMHNKLYDPRIARNLICTKENVATTSRAVENDSCLLTPASSQATVISQRFDQKSMFNNGTTFESLLDDYLYENDDDDFPDLFQNVDGMLFVDDVDKFEDLLASHANGETKDLTPYLESIAQRERQAIERETEVMLLGSEDEWFSIDAGEDIAMHMYSNEDLDHNSAAIGNRAVAQAFDSVFGGQASWKQVLEGRGCI